MNSVGTTVLLLVCAQVTSAMATECRPISGSETLLEPGKIVLVGEVHGTREMPGVLTDLVCRALVGGHSVLVGFELPKAIEPALRAYVMSDGGPIDSRSVLRSRASTGDGTGSEAMAAAIETLRRLQREYRRVSVFTVAGPPGGDRAYAEAISLARASAPQSIVYALMGNLHSRVRAGADDVAPPVGLVLRSAGENVTSVYLDFEDSSAPRQRHGPIRALAQSAAPEFDASIFVGRTHRSPSAHKTR